jgi:hypothetical protein
MAISSRRLRDSMPLKVAPTSAAVCSAAKYPQLARQKLLNALTSSTLP